MINARTFNGHNIVCFVGCKCDGGLPARRLLFIPLTAFKTTYLRAGFLKAVRERGHAFI
ncbi:hypothetical protein DCCM_2442 [Desulfocucumis palustris]|uniref:Uncharacterized protein n=1 Tax=Desulfocucumis palustris TaxID=1898651 RepID=A0A2L2XCC5_9FIRM|nr:hypothetical protein DCCM_2442 [Desulfocucumis palustris]